MPARTTVSPALIAGCLANRRAAQRELYDSCLPHLSFVARRYLNNPSDEADVLQESFLSIFRHLDQYDAGRATFRTWAGRIVVNHCLKRNAGAARRTAVEAAQPAPPRAISAEALTRLDQQELRDWLRTMPPAYYTVFNLAVVEGYDHAEIARLLRIDPALSRQRLRRARRWLAEACRTDTDSPLHAEFVARNRLRLSPLLLLILSALDPLQSL